ECCRLLARESGAEVVRIVNATGPGFLASEPRTELGQPVEFLAVGALTAQKNYPLMIEAAAMARARCPDRPFTLHIAGGGPALQELQSQIDLLGAHSFVRLLGDRHDIIDRMRAADV